MPTNQLPKTVDRRSFLKSSAVVATVDRARPGNRQCAKPRESRELWLHRLGPQGSNHLKHLSTIKTGTLRGDLRHLSSKPEERCRNDRRNPETIPDDYRRALDRKDIEAVFIVTPITCMCP